MTTQTQSDVYCSKQNFPTLHHTQLEVLRDLFVARFGGASPEVSAFPSARGCHRVYGCLCRSSLRPKTFEALVSAGALVLENGFYRVPLGLKVGV